MRLTLLILPGLTFFLSAQAPADLAERLERSQRLPLAAVRSLAAELDAAPVSPAWKPYHQACLAYAEAGLLAETEPKLARQRLDQAIATLEPRTDSESQALLIGCLGLKMGLAPMSAMSLSAKTDTLINKVLSQQPGNPRARLFQGMNIYYTPAFFGGGARKALPVLERAARDAQAESLPADPWAPRWGKAEACTWLALAQCQAGKWDAAKLSAHLAQALDPDYPLLRTGVLAKLQGK